jgi:serine/threonine protein kinase
LRNAPGRPKLPQEFLYGGTSMTGCVSCGDQWSSSPGWTPIPESGRAEATAAFLPEPKPERSVAPPASRALAPNGLRRAHGALAGCAVAGLDVEALLAEGGVGEVYRAREPNGALVAMKVLQSRHLADAGMVSRFLREVAFMRRVDHPQVAAVRAAGYLDDGRPWYSTALERGPTLGGLVRADGPLSLARALGIACDVLRGLEAVHAAVIVHRDIQPDNILLGAGGAHLIDFGFAHEEGVDTGDGVTPDSPGALVGTLRFMSPEQATRARALTVRSDLFSVALLLYYALTGRSPFRARAESDVLVALVRSAPVPLRRERRDAPEALERVLGRALAKHPDARYAGAREMCAALLDVAASLRAREADGAAAGAAC